LNGWLVVVVAVMGGGLVAKGMIQTLYFLT